MTLIFEQLGLQLTPFSFIWVFQILIRYSKFLRNAYKHYLAFFSSFQLGIFEDVKTFHDFTVCFQHIHSRMKATFSFDFRGCLFSLKIEDPGLTNLSSSLITVSILPERRPT